MQLIIFYVILLIEIAIKSKRKTEVTIMEFKSILIKAFLQAAMVAWQDFQKCTMSISKVKKRSVTLIWNSMDTIYVETWTRVKEEAVRCKVNLLPF
ncbi:MAG: hypothetical protein BHV90_14090 [Clostridiales bacterium 42_27]|nr:MAG: hypothetical protein BHV90_14090 [Clostridiales bacterium 42_27]